MSKEPIKKDEPGPTPQSDEGTAAEDKYHGYTPAQIARIEAEKDPAPAVASKESEAVKPAPKDEPPKNEEEAKRKREEEAAAAKRKAKDEDDDDDDMKGKRR
jgi:membrane protein involved in colicin uptake